MHWYRCQQQHCRDKKECDWPMSWFHHVVVGVSLLFVDRKLLTGRNDERKVFATKKQPKVLAYRWLRSGYSPFYNRQAVLAGTC